MPYKLQNAERLQF